MKRKLLKTVLGIMLLTGVFCFFLVGNAGCADKESVADKETLRIGYTLYQPMNYLGEDGKLTGHDTEFAEMVCAELGYEPEFVRIEWKNKILDLESGRIDLIWNGMTITDELKAVMLISDPYMENKQVIVAKKEKLSEYTVQTDLVKAESIVYEKESAAETVLKKIEGLSESQLKGASSQKDAVVEVFSGASEVAVIDETMAFSMTGEGSDFGKTLGYKDIGFEPEKYGIGMRFGEEELLEEINAVIAKYKEDGTLDMLYEKYIGKTLVAIPGFWAVTLSLLIGFGTTCLIFLVTLGLSLPLGLIISFGTMSRIKWLSGLLKTIIWIIRGTPLMLLVIIIYYVPGFITGSVMLPLAAVFVAFVINYSCYFSEIFRGGIQSISKGQYEAGQVLGMTKAQIFFRIVLVQIIKRIIPPMSNEIITLVKDTALARVILVEEIILRAEDFIISGIIWPLFYSAVFYLVFVGILTLLFRFAEKKLSYFKV